MITKETQRIHSFAILMAMYEHGVDYISCFIPVILQFVPDYDYTDVSTIKRDLGRIIDIPELMVQKILELALDKGYVELDQTRRLYKLKSNTLNEFIEEKEFVTKRIQQFNERIQKYLREHRFYSCIPVTEIIETFIEKCGFNLDFLQSNYSLHQSNFEIEDYSLKMLIQFLKDPTTEPIYLHTFREIVMGSIISKALIWTDIESGNISELVKCDLFLDTNFAFSLLGLHSSKVNKPVREMYKKLLQRCNFRLCIFDFTFIQMKKVICAYSSENIIYTPDAQIPSIHNTFKGKKWSKKHAVEYATKLPEILNQMGIYIVDTGLIENETFIKENLSEFVDLYRSLFVKYKPTSNNYGIQHDLAAIMMIHKIRGNSVHNLRHAKAFFLTSDRKLTDFCQYEMYHKSKGSISEVVLDMSFASMLWLLLKDEKINLSIDTIIASFSRTIFIKRKIWDRFMTVLSQMSRKKRIKIHEIPNIFYKNIQNILNEFTENDTYKVTEEFVMSKVAEACEDSEELQEKLYILQDALSVRDKKINTLNDEIKNIKNKCAETDKIIKSFSNEKIKLMSQVKVLIYTIFALILTICIIFAYFIFRQ